jgi:4-hydroxy-2-oxoheptanedioate aldolase
MKAIKERIQAGEVVHGCWINLGSPVSAEIVGHVGFDWGLIDLEHGVGDEQTMYSQLQAVAATPCASFVRTDDASRAKVQHILDSGAAGIMFPQIQSAAEAARAISLMYYPPRGVRGMAKMVRATNFGSTFQNYVDKLDKIIVGIIQIETRGALQDVEAIAALEGVDVLFVGPTDLSIALGVDNIHDPIFQQAIKNVGEACKKYNKAAGILLQDINEYSMYYDLGYRFIACGGDSQFVLKGAADIANRMKGFKK